jgi:hypothetical protein
MPIRGAISLYSEMFEKYITNGMLPTATRQVYYNISYGTGKKYRRSA